MKVKCPTCQQETEWSDQNPFRPFCCKRCKLIDLGAWASEEFSIAGASATPLDENHFPEDPTLH